MEKNCLPSPFSPREDDSSVFLFKLFIRHYFFISKKFIRKKRQTEKQSCRLHASCNECILYVSSILMSFWVKQTVVGEDFPSSFWDLEKFDESPTKDKTGVNISWMKIVKLYLIFLFIYCILLYIGIFHSIILARPVFSVWLLSMQFHSQSFQAWQAPRCLSSYANHHFKNSTLWYGNYTESTSRNNSLNFWACYVLV